MIALHASIFEGKPFLWSEGHQIGNLKDLRAATKVIPDPEPLPVDPIAFWGDIKKYEPLPGLSSVPLHAAIPKRLGPLPFWRSDRDFIIEMETIYQNSSGHAESQTLGTELPNYSPR